MNASSSDEAETATGLRRTCKVGRETVGMEREALRFGPARAAISIQFAQLGPAELGPESELREHKAKISV